jgi:hypothetical protein
MPANASTWGHQGASTAGIHNGFKTLLQLPDSRDTAIDNFNWDLQGEIRQLGKHMGLATESSIRYRINSRSHDGVTG